MRSKLDFIREQGFTTEGCQEGLYTALMFQPRVIAGLVISGVVFQSPWLFLALSTVLYRGALFPGRNLFDTFFNHVMADPKRLAAMPAAPPPRRFAQAVAGTFAMSIALTLFAGVSPAAWLLESVFVAGSMSVVTRRFCLPAYVLHLVWAGVPVRPCPPNVTPLVALSRQ
jgi:Domain of unknown function (DUF4395)